MRTTLALIAKKCDLVTSVNQAILDAYGVTDDHGLVTFNSPPPWFARSSPKPTGNSNALTFFHGKALAGNGTSVVLDAVAEVRSRGVDARVVMFPSNGNVDGPPYDAEFAARSREPDLQDSLDLLSGRPHRAMPEVLSNVDVGLIAYNRVLGVGSLPNRFFEYLALGIPVIVPEYSPLMSEIVAREGLGLTVDFEDPASVANGMQQMAADLPELTAMGRRAKESFDRTYSWAPAFHRLRDRMIS
ncbi:probable glycosyltransferase [Janibacter sp. HTCC2649]|uniref:glycosyltransferase n=1 Tax=Janibacter sp. HTCC2649 TaxID=313589 RepID=UPI0000670EDB|nr:glycosyltransferase [Janibacter sp. HTCC2649]EAP97391.1 probable glycosyltransferase [Janibacter sp. HTCC2649]